MNWIPFGSWISSGNSFLGLEVVPHTTGCKPSVSCLYSQAHIHHTYASKTVVLKPPLFQQIVLGIWAEMISYECYGTILAERASDSTTKQFIFSAFMIHSCAVCTIRLNVQLRDDKVEEIGFDSVFHSFISKITLPMISHPWQCDDNGWGQKLSLQ